MVFYDIISNFFWRSPKFIFNEFFIKFFINFQIFVKGSSLDPLIITYNDEMNTWNSFDILICALMGSAILDISNGISPRVSDTSRHGSRVYVQLCNLAFYSYILEVLNWDQGFINHLPGEGHRSKLVLFSCSELFKLPNFIWYKNVTVTF